MTSDVRTCRPWLTAIWFVATTLLLGTQVANAQSRNQTRIQPYASNPSYWQYDGEPVLLLGGSDDDNLHNWTGSQLTNQLDLLVSKGGNYIRNVVTSNDNSTGVYPFKQTNPGIYDLDQWDEAWWSKITNLLDETQQRDIIVSLEIWDAFAFTDRLSSNPWSCSPWNPKNNINYTESGTGIPEAWEEHPSQTSSPFIEIGFKPFETRSKTTRRSEGEGQ